MDILQEIGQSLTAVREKRPLVHHLTNFVTANDCANMALAIGASPVMANDPCEVEEMVAHASSLVINIGTLNSQNIASMLGAGKTANRLGIPVVFDPVGVGATKLRTSTAERIISEVRLSVIRGNMSEIRVLAGLSTDMKGVDSTAEETEGEAVAKKLAQKIGCVVAVTGRSDIIADGLKISLIDNGHAMLAGVTGTGCMATSLIACFCGAVSNSFIAATAGIAVMGIAGEVAHASLRAGDGLGAFRMKLFDAVSNMEPQTILRYGKISDCRRDNHAG